MKLSKLTALVLTATLSTTLILINSTKNVKATTEDIPSVQEKTTQTEDAALLSFPVMSDVHIDLKDTANNKFTNALKDYQSINPSYDALAVVGDFTDNGNILQYSKFMSLLNNNKVKGSEPVIATGNHEYFTGNSSLFVSQTGMPSLYYDKWIKGYHFITLGSEKGGLSAELSQNQLNWLKATLAKDTDKNKPIFLFLHQPLPNTVFGSESWGNINQAQQLQDILKEYPQVVMFSGHSHYVLQHQRTMFQKDITSFNTGSVRYLMTEDDGYADPTLSQGLYVQVFKDKVEVKCREFTSHQWVGKTYDIALPVNTPFPIADSSNPYFDNNSKITASNVTATTAKINWPAGKDDTAISSYNIYVNGTLFKKYLLDLTKATETNFNLDINSLKPGVNNLIEVEAKDEYGKVSLTKLSTSITTSTQPPFNINTGDLFNLDLSSGTAKDSSYISNTVKVNGNPKIAYDSTFKKNVVTLDGSSSYLSVPYNNSLNNTSKSVTYATSFIINDLSKTQDIMGRTQSSDMSFEYNSSTGKLEIWAHINGSYSILNSSAIEKGKIYYAVATYDGNNLNYYLNGQLVANKAITGSLTINSNIDLAIGADPENNHTGRFFLNGKVDIARIYSKPLSSSDISSLYTDYLSSVK